MQLRAEKQPTQEGAEVKGACAHSSPFLVVRRQNFHGLGHFCRAGIFPYVHAHRQTYTHSAPCLSSGHSPLPDVWLQVIGCTQMFGIARCCPGRNDGPERQEVMQRKQQPAKSSHNQLIPGIAAGPAQISNSELTWQEDFWSAGTLGPCSLRSNSCRLTAPHSVCPWSRFRKCLSLFVLFYIVAYSLGCSGESACQEASFSGWKENELTWLFFYRTLILFVISSSKLRICEGFF